MTMAVIETTSLGDTDRLITDGLRSYNGSCSAAYYTAAAGGTSNVTNYHDAAAFFWDESANRFAVGMLTDMGAVSGAIPDGASEDLISAPAYVMTVVSASAPDNATPVSESATSATTFGNDGTDETKVGQVVINQGDIYIYT